MAQVLLSMYIIYIHAPTQAALQHGLNMLLDHECRSMYDIESRNTVAGIET